MRMLSHANSPPPQKNGISAGSAVLAGLQHSAERPRRATSGVASIGPGWALARPLIHQVGLVVLENTHPHTVIIGSSSSATTSIAVIYPNGKDWCGGCGVNAASFNFSPYLLLFRLNTV